MQKDSEGIDYSKLRKHKRFDIAVECVLIDLKTNNKEKAMLTTISVGGVTLLHPELLNKGNTYDIAFTMPNGSPVTKHVEIRWLESEITNLDFKGEARDGFEHGCKFILLKEKEIEVEEEPEKPEPKIEPIEKLVHCYYHLEYFREKGSILMHGYVSKIGSLHIEFSSIVELRVKEKITVNMIINDGDTLNERKMNIDVLEIKRNGKQYNVKGVKIK